MTQTTADKSTTDIRSAEPETAQPAQADQTAWHALDLGAVYERLNTIVDGLDDAEARRRREIHGLNRLPSPRPKPAWQRFLRHFHNLLIYILIAAAGVAAVLGHMTDATVILLVVLINAIIGFIQEGRAEKALNAIRAMMVPHASVVRGGQRTTVSAEDLVPGDIVVLEPGDRVAADLRLARARNLRIDEAILTGESMAVDKATVPVAETAALGDRRSMAYSGTLVAAGFGHGIVVATGAATELGRISELLSTVQTLTTPLLRQMNTFARQLTVAILGLAAAVLAFAIYLRDYAVADGFMAVVGLVVAAIPEGLPAVMTITLAIGVQRMVRRRAIIRRLPAVETLGSVSVICSDKTGTLTKNEMTVRRAVTADSTFEVEGVGYAPHGGLRLGTQDVFPHDYPTVSRLARTALLCNDAALKQTETGWIVDGDPMEGALITFAVKMEFDAALTRKQFPRTDEIPFDSQHRFMATLHHSHAADEAFICLKGAPERILEMCTLQDGEAGPAPLDRPYWDGRVEALAMEGHRVLAIAIKPVAPGKQDLTFEDVTDGLSLLGLVGLLDPAREEAIAAVAECRTAGIGVKMITGDHGITACAIARALGLPEPDAMTTGQELDAMDNDTLRTHVRDTSVFARTSPEHKLRIVEALQANKAIVAMTGDGVNDAPALKRADIGIAMGGKGTEAAKEAAEMVLTDDNFASIVAAVREGRTVYDNLKKVIGWTLPTNGGEALAIVGAILFGATLPITPIQILWVNMITAVALGLTLAFEPTEPRAMRRPPRPPDEPILSGFLVWRIVFVSVLFVVGAFGMFTWAMERGHDLAEARTLVVNTLVVMEIFYLFSIRYLTMTSLTWTGILGTPAVSIGVGAIIAAQFAFTYLPFMQTVFETRDVAFQDGLAIVAIGIALLLILELEKLIRRLTGWAIPPRVRRQA